MTLNEAIDTAKKVMRDAPAFIHTSPSMGFNFRFGKPIEDADPTYPGKTVRWIATDKTVFFFGK
jgi:hypothetical protein